MRRARRILGARCRVGRLAEPTDDGADLARPPRARRRRAGWPGPSPAHGEGWCASVDAEPATSADLRSAGRPGPLGPERLILRGSPSRPAPTAAWTAATIAAMTDTADPPPRRPPTMPRRSPRCSPTRAIPPVRATSSSASTRFASDHSQVLVAEHEGAVLGFVAVHALPRFEHDDRIVRILAAGRRCRRARARRRSRS